MNSTNTTAEGIYLTVKKRIINLEYKPGLSLSALTLSEEMNVSRSPAREALIKLSADDLVEIFPQKGSRVSLINLNKVMEERFLRKSLEESALRIFVDKHSSDDLHKMRTVLGQQKTAWSERDFVKFITLDNKFHKMIFTGINKPRCWSLMENFGSNEFRLRLLSCQSVEKTPPAVLKNHEDLILAISNRKLVQALEITHQHLSKISDEIPKLLEEYPEIFSMDKENQNERYKRNVVHRGMNFLNTI